MHLGSLTDHLLFGTEFAYVVSPYDDFKSKDAKAWREEQRSAGLAVMKQESVEHARAMVEAVKAHRGAMEILDVGRSQVALTGTLPGGAATKGLIDWVSDAVMCLSDLKTTTDASGDEFTKHAINMGYHAAAAHYVDLWKQNTSEDIPFVWLVVETEAPFAVAVWIVSDAMLALGRRVNEARYRRYEECLKTGDWPAYSQEAVVLEPPAWAMR